MIEAKDATFPYPVWWWLSFIEKSAVSPMGDRLVGVVLVPSTNGDGALARAKLLRLDPGGVVDGFVLSCPPPSRFQNRLLSGAEARKVDDWICEQRDGWVEIINLMAAVDLEAAWRHGATLPRPAVERPTGTN